MEYSRPYALWFEFLNTRKLTCSKRNSCQTSSVMDDDTQSCLLKAENALLDCKFTSALSLSYDLFASRAIPAPIASFSFENDKSLKISLEDLDGPFSRCGAVLLQSWFELSRRNGTTAPKHFLESLISPTRTIPLDLWIVWMTLRMDHRPGDVDEVSQMGLFVLQRLVLAIHENCEISQKCRECCQELIYLVFLEWLPRLPAHRIHDLGRAYLPNYQRDATPSFKRLIQSSSCATERVTAGLNVCIAFSCACHDWAQQAAESCSSRLQKALHELQLEQEASWAGEIVPHQWQATTDAWIQCIGNVISQTMMGNGVVQNESQYRILRMNRKAIWPVAKRFMLAAVLLLGCRRIRVLLGSTTIQNGLPEILQALGYMGKRQAKR